MSRKFSGGTRFNGSDPVAIGRSLSTATLSCPTRAGSPGPLERCRAVVIAAAVLIALTPPGAAAADAGRDDSRPVTLEACLALAEQKSPSIALERQRLSEAEADDAVARAGLLPRITASALVQRLNRDRLPLGVPPPQGLYTEEAFAGVRAKQVLFDGLRAWNAHAATERGIEAARAGVTVSQADTVFAVTQAFVRLIEAQELTGVAEEAFSQQRGFEELTNALFAAGRTSRVDPLRARAQRLDAERALVAARESEEVAGVLLRKAMGLESHERLRATGSLPEAAPPGEPEQRLLAQALHRDVDIVRLDQQIAQARAATASSSATWFPEISLQASYGYRGRDIGGRATEWVGGVFLDWALFEGGAGKGLMDKASARQRQLEESRRALALQIEADLRDALAAWRVAAAAITSAAESVEASREALAAVLDLYRAGRSPALEVLTAQLELVRSEAARVQALGDHAVARARVVRRAGT